MKPETNIKEAITAKGKFIIRSHPAGTIEVMKAQLAAGQTNAYKKLLAKGKIESESQNMIMNGANTGKNLLVQWLLGIATYPVGINYIAIGTSNTAVAATDTILGAEVVRSIISYSASIGNNEVVLQTFITDANLPNNTYQEVGGFVNGNNSANSGQLFNHSLLASPYIKTNGTDTTIEIDITFT